MRIRLLLLLFILAVPVVTAEVECSKVFILKFNYNNGIITYGDKVIKCGYSPDRLLQPGEGYKAEMISMDNEVLYSFKFDIPLDVNFDSSDPLLKTLSGGMVILNETDFSLIFPYYDDVKSIIIYNPREYKVAEIPLIKEQFMQKKTFWWVLVLIALVLIVSYIIYRQLKNKPQQTTKNL